VSNLKTYTVAAGLAFIVGDTVKVASAANPTVNYEVGTITAYADTSMEVDITESHGSGEHRDWLIRLKFASGGGGGAPGDEDE
jgi:hypothetical protein